MDLAICCPVEKLVLVVPEQFTMETEKRLLTAFHVDALPASTVTSFSEMAVQYRTAYEKTGKYISDLGRHILMDRAIREQNSALNIYAGRVTRSLTEAFLAVASELKTSRLTPEELMEQADRQKGTLLGDKLHDISLVVSEYQAQLNKRYLDSLDDLTKLADGIRQYGLYRNRTVLIDGFHNFSAQEEEVISALLTQAEKVVVALPCSSVTDTGDEMDTPIFENVREEARRLIGFAQRSNIPVERPIFLKENKRAKNEALRFLETALIGSNKQKEDCNGIHLYTSCNMADEVMLLASLIGRDVRESGCRYRDCAVIARSLKDYTALLSDAFRRAGIPFYMDSRADVTILPLFTFMLSALQVAAGERRDENLFRCFKTGFFSVSMDEIYNMENYVLKWGIGKNGLFSPFTLHPRGYVDEWTERDKALLEGYEATRQRVMPPLVAFCDRLRGHFTGRTLCHAMYDLLLALNIPGQIDEECGILKEKREPVKAEEHIRLWGMVVELLEQIDLTAGDESLDIRSAVELFKVACESLDMGRIPPTADAVTVGSADRIRVPDVKRVYVLGCNEGVFPASPSGTGLLSDGDREKLNQQGIRLGGDGSYWSVEEMFIAYKAFAAPSEALTVLYRRLSFTGEKLRPSVLVHTLKNAFPALQETPMEALSPLKLALDPSTAMMVVATRHKEKDPELYVLERYLEKDERYGPVLACMRNRIHAPDAQIVQRETAAALFSKDPMRISATKLENFHRCPYSYFLQYGLRLEPQEKATLKANTIGTMIHYVLEQSLRELSQKDISSVTPEEKTACVDKWCTYYYENSMGGDTGKTAGFAYRYRRLSELAQAIVDNLIEEMKQAQYRPVVFELKMGKGGSVPSYVVPCEDGEVIFEGTVDRVDIMHGERDYLRVVDYKTNSKKFAMNDLLYGLNMQMLIYLSALRRRDARFSQCLPGGVLYFPAALVKRSRDNGNDTKEDWNDMKMNGVLLDDLSSLRGMEQDLEGRFIQPKMGKNGVIGGILVSEEEIRDIDEYIDFVLRRMHDELIQGKIGARPTENPCKFCKFRSVCDHDPVTDPCVEIEKRDTKAVLSKIKEMISKGEEGEIHA